jgi:hypothetical protein
MLNCHLKVGVPYVLRFHFYHTTSQDVAVSVSNGTSLSFDNKIYREMLSMRRHERMTIITIRGAQVRAFKFSWTTQYSIVLSWDLLAWISAEGRIPFSFTKFITSPELSGPLYINPDIYHTQITEYSLLTFYQ